VSNPPSLASRWGASHQWRVCQLTAPTLLLHCGSGWIACTSSQTEEEQEEEEEEAAEGVFRILHATNGETLTAASMVTAGGAAHWWVK